MAQEIKKTTTESSETSTKIFKQFEQLFDHVTSKWPDMTWKHRRLLSRLHPYQEGKTHGWNPISEKEWHSLQRGPDYTSCKLTATFLLDIFSTHNPEALTSSPITLDLQFNDLNRFPSEHNWELLMHTLRSAVPNNNTTGTAGITLYLTLYNRDQLRTEERPHDWSHSFVVIVYGGQCTFLQSMVNHHRLRAQVLPCKKDKKTKKFKWDFFTKLKRLVFTGTWNQTSSSVYTDLFGRKLDDKKTRKSRIHFLWEAHGWSVDDVQKNYERLLEDPKS